MWTTAARPKDKLRGNRRKILNDNLGGGFEAFLQRRLRQHPRGHQGRGLRVHEHHRSCTRCSGRSPLPAANGRTFVIWAKHTFTLGRADYQRQYEPILYGWQDGHDHYWCGARDQGDVWLFDKPARNDLHPTMKPVALVERAVRNSSKSRDIVLDPFGGSGSTLIACEKAGRQARLVELDPKYCDVIVRRWQEWTGEEAMLEGDGRSFEEIAAGRAGRGGGRRGDPDDQSGSVPSWRNRAVLPVGHAAEQLVDLDPEQRDEGLLAGVRQIWLPARRAWTRTRRRG